MVIPDPLDNQWYELSETARATYLALAHREQVRVAAAIRALMVDPTEHNLLAVRPPEREGGAGVMIFPWPDIRWPDIRIAYMRMPDGRVGIAAIFVVD